MNLLSSLANKGLIKQKDISSLIEEAKSANITVEELLEKKGIDTGDILDAKGEHLDVPTRKVDESKISEEILKYVPEESAKHYRFLPIGLADGVLEIGVTDLDNIEALDALNFISARVNLPYKIFLISNADFEKIIKLYKGISSEVGKALKEYDIDKVEGVKKKVDDDGKIDGVSMEETIKEDAPVTKIVDTILRYASEGNASDIHVEAMSDKVRVRFRVDGVLNTSLVLPSNVSRAVVARVKVLASMKLDENRKPQDGRFSASISGRKIDFRVSTFPTYYGEKIVMRILDTGKGVWGLDKMGFTEDNIEKIQRAVKRPFGLILISGPTGSGKSTTLYSMLNEVDRDKKNVLSLEDPIEYNIDGLSQSQMFPEIGYTFASGLRSVLRQDPDIIMVGEIRDKETAQLAIQAALTGHLVLSTIHTNNAAGVIPRLVDMGVDPYLIAPTLVLAIAQRLVRTLCPDSGKPMPIDGSIRAMIDAEFQGLPQDVVDSVVLGDNMYGLEETPECPNGTRGRTAVTEILEMNKELEHVILTNPVEEEIMKVARSKGMLTMKEDAIIKASNQIIPFEEVNALGGPLLIDEEAEENNN